MGKKKTKLAIKIVVILLVTALSAYYVLKDNALSVFSQISTLEFFPFLVPIAVVVAALLLDSLMLTMFTRVHDKKYQYKKAVVNTLIGNFVGCFNKTGSMFVQAYTFTKQDIDGAHAASVLTMQFLMYQFTLTIFFLVTAIVGYPYVQEVEIDILFGMNLYVLSLIGLSISLFFFIAVLLLAFCRPLHKSAVRLATNVLYRLKIIKNVEETRRKWTLQLVTYRIEIKRLSSKVPLVISTFLIDMTKLLLLACLPYFIFISLGYSHSLDFFLQSLFSSSYMSIVTSFIGIGAPEILFQVLYNYATGSMTSIVGAANILYRVLTFYLPLLVGLLVYIFYKGSPRRYELLSNTSTIYDMQVLNFKECRTKDNNYNDIDIDEIDDVDIIRSFDRIKKKISKKSNKTTKEIEMQGSENLAKVVQEYDELKKSITVSPEVEKEVENRVKEAEVEDRISIMRKYIKKRRKESRKFEKENRRLARRNPKGTEVRYDLDSGLIIDIPESYSQQRTYTQEEDER